ncbi:MAG: CRISPR-associated protein Cas4 [Polyangiaceae bacterium]
MDLDDALPISALAHLLYCERRAALVHIVGAWADNEHTAAGQELHARIDSAETTSRPDVRVLRSVHVRSERLRLTGIVDALEVRGEPGSPSFYPVETKRGARRRWVRDEIQLCAQAMAIEEMAGTSIVEGAIFHDGSKRRRVVRFTSALRCATEAAAARLHRMVAANEVPPPVADERCPACSLAGACQPHVIVPPGSLARHLRRAFE